MNKEGLRQDRRRVGTDEEMQALQERLESRIRQANDENEALRTQLEARLMAAEAARDAVLRSWSWRIMAPVRAVGSLFLRPASLLRRGGRAVAVGGAALCRRPLASAMSWVLARPQLSERINRWLLEHFPQLHHRLFEAAATTGIVDRNRDGAERPAGSPAAQGEFAEFVADFLVVPGGELLPPMLRRLGRFHGCQPEEQVSHRAGIHLDHDLMQALQGMRVVQSRPYDAVADATPGRQLIQHIYLSLLRRYPSRVDEDRYLGSLANGMPIEKLIASIRTSVEYQSFVRWA